MQLTIELDRAGFPSIFVESIGAFMHWLPVTKIQMEYFMSSTSEALYNDSWYRDVLGYNPRVSPSNINGSNYWEAFITGILPRDARNYARWARESYNLPTAQEWFDAYQYLLDIPASPEHIEQILDTPRLNARVKTLLQNVEESAQQAEFQLDGRRSLADQMLMRLGVMEFVYRDAQRNTFGGYGQTHSNFFPQMEIPRRDAPQQLANPREGAQMKQYGFRLINTRR
jgi:hypothetical protein